jgi:hypothetical protein
MFGLMSGLMLAPILACIWLWPGEASAAKPYGVVTIDLRPEIGDVPTKVCIASEVQGPRTRDTLKSLIGETESSSGDLRRWPLSPSSWGADSSAGGGCGADGGCSAQVELPQGVAQAEDLHLACATDSLLRDASPRNARVLLLMLEHLEGSPPSIEAVRLTGGVVTIGVGARLQQIVVTARSLGGHYLADQRSFRGDDAGPESKLIVLPITPRCHWIEAKLPGMYLQEDDRGRISLSANGEALDPKECLGPLRGGSVIQVHTPRSELEGRLEFRIDPGEEERPAATRFGAHWQGSWPTGKVEMIPNQLGFAWRPPRCVYPEGVCPRATLDGGIECSGRRVEDLCEYVCPGENRDSRVVEITTPIGVNFEKDEPLQQWADLLTRPGQTLDGYVGADEIYLNADVSGWDREIPGNRVTHIEVLGNDVTQRRYSVSSLENLRILAPDASCGPLRYQLVGDRRYDEGVATIEGGKVKFDRPERTTKVLSFNIVLAQGGGPAIHVEGGTDLASPSYFTGLLQLAANFRPTKPSAARWAFELRLGGTVGQYGYYGSDTAGDDPRRVTHKLPWARLLFEPAVQVNIWRSFSLSAGIGMGGSWPIKAADTRVVNRFKFVLSPSLDARFAVRKWLAFVIQGRAILFEETADLQVAGQTDPALHRNVSLLGLYGVVLSF